MPSIKYFFRFIGAVFFVFFDWTARFLWASWLNITNNQEKPENYKNGFVFTSDIGDVVIFSTFLQVFSEKIDSRCVVITSHANAGLVRPFFPAADFLAVDYLKYKTNLMYRFKKIKEMMSVSLDRCIVPMRSRDYILTDSIAKTTNKKTTMAFISDDSNRNKFETYVERFVYDEFIQSFSATSHELVSYKVLSDKLGFDFQAELANLIPAYRNKVREQVSAPPPDAPSPKNYVLMNVGASQVYKRWPVEKYISLAKKIYVERGLTSVFIGGPSERNLQGTFGSYPFIVDFILRTESFELLRWLIVNAKMAVSNDTFVGHYSITLGVPTVSLAGGGHFGRFLPYPTDDFPMFSNSYTVFKRLPCFNCKWVCTQITGNQANRYFPCVSEISVEDVFAALAKV